MAEIRCPKCGRKNPDILDVCQFCQTPLKTDSVLHIGQPPTKKDTGELEAVLPDWLKNVRQQAKSSAEEQAAQEAAVQPKVENEKEEVPDFLAGLVSQSGDSGEEEIPDWLASINPVAGPKPVTPSTSAPPESDFFAQFAEKESEPARKPVQPQADVPASPEPAAEPVSDSAEDDLSKWFARASQQPEEIVQVGSDSQPQGDAPWTGDFASPAQPSQEEPPPKEEEDLSWLHNLEDAAKQTGDLQAPKQDRDWLANLEASSTSSEPSRGQEDLSWLDSLGAVEKSAQQVPEQPSAGEDLSWLNNLGGVPASQPFEVTPEKPASTPPFTSDEDLSWLNNLGESQSSQPADAPSSQEDLSWLNDLGGGSGQQSAPPFIETGAQVAPFDEAPFGKQEEEQPDWLKSALETPSTPPSGDASMDWFADTGQPFASAQDRAAQEQPIPPAGTTPPSVVPPSQPEPAPFSDLFAAAPSEPSSFSSQDVDSLFSVEMPDWLSRSESAAQRPAPQETASPSAGGEDSLAPVELPSWVQAMRPVEAVISDQQASGAEEGPEEKEGPLAGLRGVIPGAAIGSSLKPKPVALKLQATNEQQASAVLLEKILGSETNPRALITSSLITSQRWLRWVLAGLFWIILGAVIFSQSQIMPVSPVSPADESQVFSSVAPVAKAFNTVANIPTGSKVLVVMDYEPSLAGEMEAVGGPLLDQLTLQRNPQLSFVSMSPTGSALVERLLSNTRINPPGQPASVQYRNLGFLPGDSAGVLGFVEGPGATIPASEEAEFSNYAMVILMTDHAEAGRIWVEQLSAQKQKDPRLANQSLIVIASAQAGPLLQPYWSSGQVTGMVSGLADAARYEATNLNRPGIARSYWDAFGVGLAMSVVLIAIGSLWSLITGIRARRAEAEQG